MNIQHLDDVLAELANRFMQSSQFSLTPKEAGRIIGQLAMEVRSRREAAERRDAPSAKEAAK